MTRNLVRSAIEQIDVQPSAEFLDTVRAHLLAELTRADATPQMPSTRQYVALESSPSSVLPRRQISKILLAVAASIALLATGAVIINRASDGSDATKLHDVDRQEALRLGQAALIAPATLGASWRSGDALTDAEVIPEIAAVVAARPECAALRDFGLSPPTTTGVAAAQLLVSSSGSVAHTVFVYATAADASRAMDYIDSDGFPECHFAVFDRLAALGLGTPAPTSEAWDAPQIPSNGDRQIIIGQLAHIKPGTEYYIINAYVQVGRAISWINPRYLPEADQPLFRADKAMNAAADAVESAFGS